MPKTVFISYANEAMAYALKRIGRQARKTGVFDEVILYTPSDVPEYVKESPLFACPKGAGYWSWKPAIIFETLKHNEEGTIVFYADAGCTLRKSSRWVELIGLMDKYDSILFQYGEFQPQWKKWGSESSELKYWTKKKTLDYLEKYTGNHKLGHACSVMAGCIIMKGRENMLLNKWKEIIEKHPELIEDPTPSELKDQYSFFSGHRHDQAILTALATLDEKSLLLPETAEQYSRDAFIWASRIRARNFREFVVIQIKHYFRIWLGDERFERLKVHL